MKTEKLELAHLAAYLPYGLQIQDKYDGILVRYDLTMTNIYDVLHSQNKPCLIPLKEDCIAEYDLDETCCNSRLRLISMIITGSANYKQFVYMTSRHFDVFGLIEKGLALPLTYKIIRKEDEKRTY
jgi:hypothetical protein